MAFLVAGWPHGRIVGDVMALPADQDYVPVVIGTAQATKLDMVTLHIFEPAKRFAGEALAFLKFEQAVLLVEGFSPSHDQFVHAALMKSLSAVRNR